MTLRCVVVRNGKHDRLRLTIFENIGVKNTPYRYGLVCRFLLVFILVSAICFGLVWYWIGCFMVYVFVFLGGFFFCVTSLARFPKHISHRSSQHVRQA